jgi:tRNA threonylcarbamoyladenosine biosynthesis protein TsaB
MRTLVIDTATRACSVALYDDHQLVAAHYEVIGRGHAERLLPFIAALPGRGLADQIVVNVGPGSFTGIRVGVAAARALGLAWRVPVSGYGCLMLVAAISRAQMGRSVSVDVVMTGGHGEYFVQSFDSNAVPAAAAVSVEAAMIAARSDVIAGDTDVPIRSASPIRLNILPDARCWHLIADEARISPSPVYGRAPDATLPGGVAA